MLILFFPWLFLYAKSVDQACMIKEINTRLLTEGEWLYKDVKVGNKVVKATWDGVSKKDIELIKSKHKSVLIRHMSISLKLTIYLSGIVLSYF